jgi:hypothetical protein
MENLTAEGRAIYDTVTAAAATQAQHMQDMVALITESVNSAVDAAVARTVDSAMRSCVSKATADMQVYTDGVESSLQWNMDALRAQLGLAAPADESLLHHRSTASDAEIGPNGHGGASIPRRQGVGASGPYIPPPARGNQAQSHSLGMPRSFEIDDDTANRSSYTRMPKMDIPSFDGDHPKLWQLQCEDYFEMYNTPQHLWVRLASLQFTGSAAKWLSSIQSSIRKFTWLEFSQEVVLRFGRSLMKLIQINCIT